MKGLISFLLAILVLGAMVFVALRYTEAALVVLFAFAIIGVFATLTGFIRSLL